MTIISDNEKVRETVIGKSSEEVRKKISVIPNICNVKKVCIDMCASFAKAIKEEIPQAEVISDRFHLIKLINEKLWNLNKKTFNNLDEKARQRFSQIRYLISKDYREINRWEKRLIKDYLRLNSEIKHVYWKVQAFRRILFNSYRQKRSDVSMKLANWIEGTRKYFGKFVKTLETWWDEVVNACIYRESNARQEGINNKIKMIKRRGFGYRNWLNFEHRIYAECNV